MTPAQLSQATGARIDRATEWLSVIEAAMQEFGIDTRLRQAMFLAQIGHESGGMRYTTELWGPTPSQSGYEGRIDLGNTQEGDGYRCRGWGLIQTTGRFNLTAVGAALGFDAINDEAARADRGYIARSAGYYWKTNNLNRFADAGDIVGGSKKINGGTNGLEHRKTLYQAALLAVPEIVKPIEAIEPPKPVGLLALIFKILQAIFSKKT